MSISKLPISAQYLFSRGVTQDHLFSRGVTPTAHTHVLTEASDLFLKLPSHLHHTIEQRKSGEPYLLFTHLPLLLEYMGPCQGKYWASISGRGPVKLGQRLQGIWVIFRSLAACDMWHLIHAWHKPITINGTAPDMNLFGPSLGNVLARFRPAMHLIWVFSKVHGDACCVAERQLLSLQLLLSPWRGFKFI